MVFKTAFSDQELTALLKSGDHAAFSSLYHKYSGQIYLNILKMLKDERIAEELVQDLFTKIWQKREALDDQVNFAGYLFRISQNLVYDYFRKLQRNKKLYDQFQKIATENYSHIEEALHLKESESLLFKAIDQLSPQQQNVYRMCKLEGLSYKEAAAQLGISTHTVKEYLSKANQLVKDHLLQHMDVSLLLLLLMAFKDKIQ